MSRPSEPLLRVLRKILQDRKMSAAALAEATGLPRPRVRQVLTGGEPMTVDELLQISQALQLSPTDFGMAAPDPGVDDPTLDAADLEPELDLGGELLRVDPFGNQPRQLLELGFALGCDFFFLARADELADSGIPAAVLERYAGRDVPIQMDSAYHQYNEPQFDDAGVSLMLSFDALYRCRFPWAAIRQVNFFPAPPSTSEPEPEKEPAPEDTPKRSHLRLVE